MKYLFKYLLILVLYCPSILFSQIPNGSDVVIEISKEKIIVNGKSFFLHKVKKGENLYRISKAYNVTQKDVIIANPEAISGNIKEGQTLKIPLETNPNGVPQIQSDNFIYHITEDKQTIFFITQKYKITQEELYKYNPELQYSPLQLGQVVKIPKNPNAPVGPDKFKPIERYIEYKVERKETKYSIAKDYNISVDELIAANPILNTEDLKKGQILQIPVKSENEVIALPIINKPDTVKPIVESKDTTPCNNFKAFSETINVSILLPIFLEGNETLAMLDSINAEKDEKRSYETNEVYQLTANLLEFYQGALLALDSLKKAGMTVVLRTYDTGKDNQKINSILAKPELAKMDLIIGPLTYNTETLEKVAQFALKNQIKMVSPVSSNIKILRNNPYIFQINANETFNIDALLRYMSTTYNNKNNIILVNSNKIQDRDTFELYKNKLTTYFPNQFKIFNYNDNPKQISLLLQNNVDNLIIIPSEQEAVVKTILNHLNYLPKSQPIKVFGLPSWAIFRGVEQEFLHNLEFQYPSSFYVNFNAPPVHNFLNKYKLFYKTSPSYHTKDNSPQFFTKDGYNFAFLGYDLTFYFLNSMGRVGKNFENCFGQQKIDLLHTNIIFERLDNQSGYLNKGVDIIKYTKDYTIEKVN